jgi:hypothetical protein
MPQTLDNLTYTWNASGTTFTGIKFNVTDTASAAGSLLMDLQRNGTSVFSLASQSATIRTYIFAGYKRFLVTGSSIFELDENGIYTNGGLGFATGLSSADLRLSRDAAQTLAQRNGTNAQTFRLYNTFTDASNYERGKIEWASNVLRIGTEKAGTGTARNVAIQTDGTTRATFSGFGVTLQDTALLDWSGRSGFTSPADGVISMRNAADNAGSALQFREQTAPAAPAADNVRIYAEDDGSGKTRLMARFATGAAVQIAIEP